MQMIVLLPEDGLMNKNTRNPLHVHAITLGCKVNQFESESIAAELEKLDFSDLCNKDSMDICVINTCTVTQKSIHAVQTGDSQGHP